MAIKLAHQTEIPEINEKVELPPPSKPKRINPVVESAEYALKVRLQINRVLCF